MTPLSYTDDQAMRRAINRQRFLQGLPPIPDNMPVTMDAQGLPQQMPLSPFASTPRAPDPLPVGQSRPPADIAPNIDWGRVKHAIAGIESGGRYDKLGKVLKNGDVALGKYQVMASNVRRWSQDALGEALSPKEFLNSPEAQEKVFEHRFGNYIRKYGPEGAARAWYAGEGGMKNLNATDIHGRLTVSGYGQDFLRRMGQAPTNVAATSPPPRPPRDIPMPETRVARQDQPLRLAPASFQAKQELPPPPRTMSYAPPPPRPAAVAAIDQAIAPRPQARSPLSLAPPTLQQPAQEMRWQGPLGEGDMGRYEPVGVEPPNGLNSFLGNLFSPPSAPTPDAVPMPRPRPFIEGQAAPALAPPMQTPEALPLAPFQQPPYPMDWWRSNFGGFGGFGGGGFSMPNFDLHLGG